MADKARRLHFTEDELSDRDIRRAAKKADKAADKADRANEKLPTKRRVRITRDSGRAEAVYERLSDKLHQSRQSSKADREKEKAPSKRKPRTTARSGKVEATAERLSDKLRRSPQSTIAARGKLRIEVTEVTAQKPGAGGRAAVNAPAAALHAARNTVRDAVGRSDNDGEGNSGADALQSGESTVRNTGNVVNNRHYSHKLKQYDKAARLERKSDSTNVEALYQRERHNSPNHSSNPISKWRQKQELKKRYMEAKASGKAGASGAAKGGKRAAEGTKSLVDKGIEFVKEHPKAILIAGVLGLLVMLIAGMFSSCTAMFAGSGNAVLGTSYTAEDADILGADADYSALETALDNQISNIESTHPGYDEYRYDLDSIGHNPHELASYLTALLQTYTPATAQAEIQRIFELQYTLTLTEEVEIRYRTETSTDPDTGETTTEEVPYEYFILNIKLENKPISELAPGLLTPEQLEMFRVYLETSGNKPLIFGGGSPDGNPSEDLSGVQLVNGTRPGNTAVVDRAKSQVGNVGGQPYWSWYGFNSRVEWCACFVSWCYNQAGKSEPRFAACQSQGVPWFQSRGQWGARGYENIAPGDAIFFDWDGDGSADHVGLVIGTDGQRVYTVEGNSGDACKIKSYPLDYGCIKGYGLMNWN